MAWHQTGDKPLSEPIVAQFTDAYMIYALLGLNKLNRVSWLDDYHWDYHPGAPEIVLGGSMMGSWDPTAFGKWGPFWKIGVLHVDKVQKSNKTFIQ